MLIKAYMWLACKLDPVECRHEQLQSSVYLYKRYMYPVRHTSQM
jgi:hypothetical protein